MRFAELLERPLPLLAAAIALQWLTALVVALQAADVTLGAIELVDVVLLGPVALVCAHRIASAIGGAALGAWTLLVWVTAPWVLQAVTLASYDETLRDRVLPLALGLDPDLRFAAGVALTAAAALLVQLRSERRRVVAAAAGVAVLAIVLALTGDDLSRAASDGNMAGLREYFWSQRVLQWLPLAGVVAIARRSPGAALALGGWFAAFLILRGASPAVGLDGGELFRALVPALPAYVLLAAALPLLVPTLAARLGRRARPVSPAARRPA